MYFNGPRQGAVGAALQAAARAIDMSIAAGDLPVASVDHNKVSLSQHQGHWGLPTIAQSLWPIVCPW